MIEVVYATRAVADLEGLVGGLLEADPQRARQVIRRVAEAVELLGSHPLLGRPAESGLRELVISQGDTGYVALYRYLPGEEAVLVLSIRTQEEAGYADPDEPIVATG